MVKLTSAIDGQWVIYDNKRSTTNPRTKKLAANSSASENDSSVTGGATAHQVNFLSNGFELLQSGTSVNTNKSGQTYIYLAIAADPDTTTPTVADSFDVVTYNGTGAAQDIQTDFKPDLVWIKNRDDSADHRLFDSVRGATLEIASNSTSTEDAISTSLTSFNSDGFSVGSQNDVNGSGDEIVAWVWKANDHDDNLPEINTEGTIDSTVSVNDAAGFSIVKYTGNGSNGATIGHGLSSAPEMIIIKNLSDSENWSVYGAGSASDNLGETKVGHLNLSNAFSTSGDWNNTAPTSTVFTVGSSNRVNTTDNFVAYCWYSVSGHSKIGTYNGTGASGNTVTLGFQPRWILIKRVDAGDRWLIADTERADALTNIDDFLDAQDAAQEQTFGVTNAIDIESNGFEINSTDGAINASGTNNYIYMAFK